MANDDANQVNGRLGATPKHVPFGDVRAKLSVKVSRVPVWDDQRRVQYVIHQSMIDELVAESGTIEGESLEDCLLDDDMRSILTRIAFVTRHGTLADAKTQMTNIRGCQDIFVTNAAIADKGR